MSVAREVLECALEYDRECGSPGCADPLCDPRFERAGDRSGEYFGLESFARCPV
jgi:hypothetical protein